MAVSVRVEFTAGDVVLGEIVQVGRGVDEVGGGGVVGGVVGGATTLVERQSMLTPALLLVPALFVATSE